MIRLCSTSATRAKLLKEFNINFIQSKIEFDEDSIKENNPKSFVYSVAKGKLKEALKSYPLEMPLLVADTVVSANGEILRKARDREDAKRILLKQSGNSVDIITATFFKGESFEFNNISKTTYAFDNFNLDDLEEYLNSGEWIGKAGACMVEGFCKKYIKSVTGLESNAMGLPVEKLLPWLKF